MRDRTCADEALQNEYEAAQIRAARLEKALRGLMAVTQGNGDTRARTLAAIKAAEKVLEEA